MFPIPDGTSFATNLIDRWVGSDLKTRRGLCHLEYPICHGIIEDWDKMELLWKHIFSDRQLGVESKEHPVLLTEAPFSPRKQAERMAEFFFEKMQSPALYIAPQPLLSLYSVGKDTGIVVEIGEGVSSYFPVYDGFAMTPHIKRVDLGGREVTTYLQQLLRRNGVILSTSSEFEIVREIKENYSECNTEAVTDTQRSQLIDCVLPDGKVIQLGEERFQCTEVLFDPMVIGYEPMGVPEMIAQTIQSCDLELRSSLYSNVILSGGVTTTKGFAKRVLERLMTIPPSTKICLYSPPKRTQSAWVGGCLLATLSPFKNMWIMKEEYEEEGVNCVHKKCWIDRKSVV